ncbi:MAG: bifunctional adenosylcobinamide kinase/adenosylcobinamide-phosphate guanylyltransferase [Candidatus Omnitrophica bacterium]|nr:bifunctional adenosylcobinamide kinase/adenosylcobinamide-phosphate guanylyltransferase [Candidatus Omnitrophota bacterium]
MGKITFILGGARSGKSKYALDLAGNLGGKVVFIATCQPKDAEMKKRINIHRNLRPSHWKTFEEPLDLRLPLKKIGSRFDIIIIDCLTLLVSNLILKGIKENKIKARFRKLVSMLTKTKAQTIIVSNEVGLGIVPQNKLARDFRDIAGRINQMIAAESDEIYFLISGIPWRIK